jgi:hypothetical protein
MTMEHNEEMTNEKMMWRMRRREHMAMRALTLVIGIVFVFWCGFELGEIRASISIGHNFSENRMMMGGGWGYPVPAVSTGTMTPQGTGSQSGTIPSTDPSAAGK